MDLTEAFTLLLSTAQKEALRHIAFKEHKSMGALVRDRLFSDGDLADKASFFTDDVRDVEHRVENEAQPA